MTTTQVNPRDPRVKRTRQLLLQAFLSLMAEKSFAAITVQDIAERATVNRATFYAHFEGKHDLADHWLREQFRERWAASMSLDTLPTEAAVRSLCLTVMAALAELFDHCGQLDRQFRPMLEQAMQETLHEFIVTWMQRHAPADARESDYDTAALIMSWAFIVVGMRWGRSDRSRQAEELAAQVVGVLTYGVSALLQRPAANDLLIEQRR